MLPIATVEQLRAADAAATEPIDVLIERAGQAVARTALRMLGGAYGRTVVVIAGKGNNGNDGRVAARVLASKGVRIIELDADDCPPQVPPADLIIDAAYGTGFRGTWKPPDTGDAPVLAVDIPSGVNADTGAIDGDVIAATSTVTFVAPTFGLMCPPGSDVAGEIEVADIGIALGRGVRTHLVDADAVREWWPVPASDDHKWRTALRVIAGSPTMPGAAALVSGAAMRSGAGMVHLSAPGVTIDAPVEVVQRSIAASAWNADVLGSLDRFHAVVIGPGLGRRPDTAESIRQTVARCTLPMVIDGDGLFALSWNALGAAHLLRSRSGGAVVLTPHDGEYAMLAGAPPDGNRVVAARRLALDTDCVVLLKGPATVVADPDGSALVINTGDVRLATAGSGDVLAGIIGRLLAAGVPALHAAAAAAWVHGSAARRGPRVGLVASDLPLLVSNVLSEVL